MQFTTCCFWCTLRVGTSRGGVFVVVQLPAVEGTPLPPPGRHILHFAFCAFCKLQLQPLRMSVSRPCFHKQKHGSIQIIPQQAKSTNNYRCFNKSNNKHNTHFRNSATTTGRSTSCLFQRSIDSIARSTSPGFHWLLSSSLSIALSSLRSRCQISSGCPFIPWQHDSLVVRSHQRNHMFVQHFRDVLRLAGEISSHRSHRSSLECSRAHSLRLIELGHLSSILLNKNNHVIAFLIRIIGLAS